MLAQATPCRRARCPPAERKSAAAIRAQQLWRKIRAACMDILIHNSSAHSRARNLPPSSVSTNAVPPDWEQLLRGGGCPGKFRRSSVYRDLGGLQDKQDKLTARTAKIRKNELRGLIGCRAFIYLLSEANGPLFQVATLTGLMLVPRHSHPAGPASAGSDSAVPTASARTLRVQIRLTAIATKVATLTGFEPVLLP